MALHIVQCVRKVLSVVCLLGRLVTAHAGIVKWCHIEVWIIFENAVKYKIINLGRDFTILVKQKSVDLVIKL